MEKSDKQEIINQIFARIELLKELVEDRQSLSLLTSMETDMEFIKQYEK